MKTSIIAVVLFLMCLSAGANTGSESIKDISHKIKESVVTPESLKQKHRSEKVTVDFIVNENGHVIEVNAKTKDTAAKRDLENQFLQFTFEGLKPCVNNSIDINFLVY